MKKQIRLLTCLLLVLTTLLPTLAGCSSVEKSACISYGELSVSRAIFRYLCSVEKTNYLYEAYGLDSTKVSSSQLQDNAALWSAKAKDGTTVATSLKMEVIESVQTSLYLAQYAISQGYELSAEQKKAIQADFDEIVASFETKKKFNEHMAKYGTDYDQILQYNYIQNLAWQGNELLFGEGGKMAIGTENAKKYFKDQYITVDCLFINTKNKTYPNGKTVILPEAEKKEKEDLAASVFAALQAGEDFSALCLEHSDIPVTEESARAGYTFREGGFVNAEAEKKAFEMKEGELCRVDTDEGVYLLSRKALDMDYYEKDQDAIIETLVNAKKLALVLDEKDGYTLDQEYLDSLDISALSHMV